MLSINMPQGVRLVADRISDLTDDIKYCALCGLICFFLLNQKSFSALVRQAPFAMSVSSLTRYAKLFPFNRFRKRLLRSVLRKYGGSIDPENFAFVIDDTANPKSGQRIFGKGVWGGSQGTYNGQKVMVLALVDLKSHAAVPLAYEILPKRKDKKDPSAIDHAVELLKAVLKEGYPKLNVVADSWFDSVKFMAEIESLGCHYVGEIKSNRRVKINPGVNVKDISLSQAFEDQKRYRTVTSWDSRDIQQRKKTGKSVAERHIQLNNRTKPIKCIAVFNRRNALSPFAYYVSTDRSMSRARIWMLSRARWSIECIFRTVKQCLAFGRLSCSGEAAAHLAVGMPLYLYMLLRLEPPEFWGLTQLESPDRMLGKIREKSLDQTIQILLSNPNHERVHILRNRRSMARVHQKPCDKTAGGAIAA